MAGSTTSSDAMTLKSATNPAPIITQSLIQRLRSRDAESFADRLLAAMRNQFGGHAIKRGNDK